MAEVGNEAPEGLIVHMAMATPRGVRIADVWASQRHWQRFHDERLVPSLRKVLPTLGFRVLFPEPPLREIPTRDIWMP
jgi:hypothetical protein